MRKELRCPWCYSTHVSAEFVDVGVGMMQCSPYGCDDCHSYEIRDREKRPGEKLRSGWREGEWYRTVMQRHSNFMLRMRRIMKEITVLLHLQDPDYEISDEEAERVLKVAGWDELRTQRALNRIMEKLDA